jgi:hypothetical protein
MMDSDNKENNEKRAGEGERDEKKPRRREKSIASGISSSPFLTFFSWWFVLYILV